MKRKKGKNVYPSRGLISVCSLTSKASPFARCSSAKTPMCGSAASGKIPTPAIGSKIHCGSTGPYCGHSPHLTTSVLCRKMS